MEDYRIEKDSLVNVKVPAEAFYGAQTQRAVENFPISGIRFPRVFIRALGLIKAAAPRSTRTSACSTPGGRRHPAGGAEVADGKWDDHFPLDIFQTGSGTSTNMNANEVIAAPRQPAPRQSRTPGPSEQSRQHGPVLQRRDPGRDPRERLYRGDTKCFFPPFGTSPRSKNGKRVA